MLPYVAGIPVEEAPLAVPALLAGVTVVAVYLRATTPAPAPLNPPVIRIG